MSVVRILLYKLYNIEYTVRTKVGEKLAIHFDVTHDKSSTMKIHYSSFVGLIFWSKYSKFYFTIEYCFDFFRSSLGQFRIQ